MVMVEQKKPCQCKCGYSCGRKCGLEIMECMEKHYFHECEHQWDGEGVEGEIPGGGSFSSATCSKCGMSAISHDMRCGP
jgi:hypothetical protein